MKDVLQELRDKDGKKSKGGVYSNKKSDESSGSSENNNNNKGPKDSKEVAAPKHVFENNDKHNMNSTGNTSLPPKNGQKALDNSIEVSHKRRIGIEDGKLVEFKMHEAGKWHGYLIEDVLLDLEGWVISFLHKS